MWLILALLALPLIEIALFVVVGGAIGLWATLAWVVVSAILGVLTLRFVARLGPISFQRDVSALYNPSSPVAHRALTILAGVLLILPGFFTDAVGLLLLLTPVQAGIIGFLVRLQKKRESENPASVTVEGQWTNVPSAGEAPTSGANNASPPSGLTRH
jgi:UPF0716 protein FxsA